MRTKKPHVSTLSWVVFLSAAVLGGCRPSASATEVVTSADVAAAPAGTHVGTSPGGAGHGTPLAPLSGHALAAFSEGCFWGSEDTFRHVAGVTATAVGYTGGHTKNPSYEDVCDHTTGHAETVLVEFDPRVVSYNQLLAVFWNSHDPTTLNRQGPDFGDQYRSSIWTFSADEDAAARASMAEEQKRTEGTIVTEIRPMGLFWIAEGYHQQYDEKTGRHSCPLPRHPTPI
jgi:peptide-methionine (S)-S-oxide reductase